MVDNEQKSAEGAEQKDATIHPGEGTTTQTGDVLERADSIAKRLEEANRLAAEHLQKQQEIYARMKFGGKSDAGEMQKKKEEITNAEYADMAITGKFNK